MYWRRGSARSLAAGSARSGSTHWTAIWPSAASLPGPNKAELLRHTLGYSQLVHAVMKRLFPEWWGQGSDTQVHDEQTAREVACALLHEVERLTKSRGSELIVFAQHQEVETPSESLAAERVLSCLSDPATRVLT